MNDDTARVQQSLGDEYVVERQLGRGGMGAVYLARDVRLQRPVAIKVLPPELAVQADLRERFVRETRVAASFSHPNIVPVHAVLVRDDLLAFVMGYVDGETLTERVRRAPLPIADAIRIVQEVAWALSYAHGRGVVHRDIKADNILIERATGRALVTDFGIARDVGPSAAAGLTRVGEVVGTPEFMSPEQAAGDVVDGRSDLYSLGVVAYFAVSGELPFTAATPTALLALHLTRAAPNVSAVRSDAPPDLSALIDRCLEKDPESRWPSADGVAAALDAMRRSAPEIAPPVRNFLHRFNTAVVMAALMLYVAVGLVPRPGKGELLDRLALISVIGACGIGVLFAGLRRIRGLVQQGYRHGDVVGATALLLKEEQSARDAIRASAPEMARRKRNIRVGVAAILWSIFCIWEVRHVMRTPIAGMPGLYRVSRPGVIASIGASITFGFGVALLLSDPLKPNLLLRLQEWFWRHTPGRILFRLYGGTPAPARDGAAMRGGATGAGALTVLAALPREQRQQLASVRKALHAMQSELDGLSVRERELNAALREVGDHARHASGAKVEAEIREHLAGLSTRRESLTAAIEQVRLELVRLRAGIGSSAAVERAATVNS